jgi:DNA-directed RNA polymerase subunit E'/Rpb7
MVFFQKRLSHTLVLHPSLLGPALPQHAREQLVAEVEGRPVDDDGFIITGASSRGQPRDCAR